MLILIMVQSSLLMGGNIAVHYSAFCAARSAIVYIPADFDNEPHNVLLPTEISPKFERIKRAALWPLLPVSAGGENWDAANADNINDSLKSFMQDYGEEPPGWLDERMGRKLQYAMDYTRVEIAPPVDGQKYKPAEDIRVRVTHTLHLGVPYGGWLFAQLPGGVELNSDDNEYGTEVQATCVLTNEGVRDWIDREMYTE
jgi:hypothetical protein